MKYTIIFFRFYAPLIFFVFLVCGSSHSPVKINVNSLKVPSSYTICLKVLYILLYKFSLIMCTSSRIFQAMTVHGEADVVTSMYLRLAWERNKCLIDIVLYHSCVKFLNEWPMLNYDEISLLRDLHMWKRDIG